MGNWPSNYTTPTANSAFGGKVIQNNMLEGGYGVTDAILISGHRCVKTKDDLYAIPTQILSPNKSNGGTDFTDAIGQLWYVTNEDKYYKLINYGNKGEASGWTEVSIESKSESNATLEKINERLTTLENEVVWRSKLSGGTLTKTKYLWTGTLDEFNKLENNHPEDTTFIITN